jgi:hypothetical protein
VTDAALRHEVTPLLHVREQNGPAAVRAQARKLINWLGNNERGARDQQPVTAAGAASPPGKAARWDSADIDALI